MTSAEQQARYAAKVEAAWATLATSDAFKTILEDAQSKTRFGMFQPSFRKEDGFNPHAAAQRDGNKEVLADFVRRIAHNGAVLTNSQEQTS